MSKYDDEFIARVVQYYVEGHAFRETANHFELTRYSVQKWVGEADKIRSRGKSKALRESAVNYYMEGHTLMEAAEKFSVCERTVWIWSKAAGCRKRPTMRTREQVRLYRDQGHSAIETAKHFNVTAQSVSRWTKETEPALSNRFSNSIAREAVELYLSGVPMKDVSKQYGIAVATLCTWVCKVRDGYQPRPNSSDGAKEQYQKMIMDHVEAATQFDREGNSPEETLERFGICADLLRKWAGTHKAGVRHRRKDIANPERD